MQRSVLRPAVPGGPAWVQSTHRKLCFYALLFVPKPAWVRRGLRLCCHTYTEIWWTRYEFILNIL